MAREVWEDPKLKRLLPDIRSALEHLVKSGATDTEIGVHLKVSRSTARNIREAAGLPRNSREKTRRVQIRLPVSLLDDLQREAAAKDWALSDAIRHRCARAVSP